MSRFWEIVFCVSLLFRRHVCLSNLKHAPSRELPLTARKNVFSHLKEANDSNCAGIYCWFHTTSLKFKLQNYRSYWDFTFMTYYSSRKLIFIQLFAFVPKLGNRCFCWFRLQCWCPSRWAPAWRLHTNLYKFG